LAARSPSVKAGDLQSTALVNGYLSGSKRLLLQPLEFGERMSPIAAPGQ
jgi:hypothetical protein